MIDKEYRQLIQKEVDNLASDSERSQLQRYLSSNPEAKQLYESMMAMKHALDNAPQVDPPPGLREKIMRRVRAGQLTVPKRPAPVRTILDAFKARMSIGRVFAFSAGVAVGALLILLAGSDSGRFDALDPNHISGAMAPESLCDRMQVQDSRTFTAARLSGSIETKREGNVVVARLNIKSAVLIEIELKFDPDIMGLDGYSRSGPAGNLISAGNGRVVLKHQGENRYTLIFNSNQAAVSPLSYRISDGEEIIEGTLSTGQKR